MVMIRRPMKGAAVDDLSQVTFPKLGSFKIDGFRCVLNAHPLTSRLSRFPNEHFHRSASGLLLPHHILDGEVVVGSRRGKGVLQRTSSGLTSTDGVPDWKYWVFDAPGLDCGFYDRYLNAESIVCNLEHPQIRLLKHVWLETLNDLEAFLAKALKLGFEGVYLRDPKGPYKEGKSTLRQQWALKVKPFEDAEGRVKGWFEEMENTNEAKREITGKLKRSSAKVGMVGKDRLGGLILEDVKTGVEVRVGGGFTKDQRIGLWSVRGKLLNKLVKYKKQKMGEKDKPRHPNFVDFIDFRPDWDI